MITDMEKYIDIGVNLTGSSFKKDINQVIERAREVNVEHLIVTGTNIEHSEKAIKLADISGNGYQKELKNQYLAKLKSMTD